MLPLNVSASATFADDGAGSTIARASLRPSVYGIAWRVKRMITSTTSTGVNGSSRLYVYLNADSPTNLLDATYSGDQDINETDLFLGSLDSLEFKWTGGDIGATATIVVTGAIESAF